MARRAHKLSKATSYLNRICTIEYDLHGAVQAYGVDFVHWLVDEIADGRVDCKQDVDRWAAHMRSEAHLNKDFFSKSSELDNLIEHAI